MHNKVRFSSYTSRSYPTQGTDFQFASSVRGNAHYHLPLGTDAQVDKARVLTHQESKDLLAGTLSGGLTAGNWNDKIMGHLWLVRPDERPVGCAGGAEVLQGSGW